MRQQHEITTSAPLLGKDGDLLEPGWARSLLPVYRRADIKASPMRIKEWDYYLITDGHIGLALTIADNGYMGLDSISPYLPYCEQQGKGVFVLCRTSNPGAKDFEYKKLDDGRHVYDLVGDSLTALGKDYMGEHGYSSIGLVIGGTHTEEATAIRAAYKNTFFLIPGYGAQGGKAADIAQYLTQGNGGVVNSSRGILLAYKKQPGVAFDEAAYNECVRMREDIQGECNKL